MPDQIGAGTTMQLDERSIGDLMLAYMAGNERSLVAALNRLLRESSKIEGVLDATAEPIRRQDLARKTKIDSTNLSKVTGPLVRAGWLKSSADSAGVVFRRSPVVDFLVRGRRIAQWREAAKREFGGPL